MSSRGRAKHPLSSPSLPLNLVHDTTTTTPPGPCSGRAHHPERRGGTEAYRRGEHMGRVGFDPRSLSSPPWNCRSPESHPTCHVPFPPRRIGKYRKGTSSARGPGVRAWRVAFRARAGTAFTTGQSRCPDLWRRRQDPRDPNLGSRDPDRVCVCVFARVREGVCARVCV